MLFLLRVKSEEWRVVDWRALRAFINLEAGVAALYGLVK